MREEDEEEEEALAFGRKAAGTAVRIPPGPGRAFEREEVSFRIFIFVPHQGHFCLLAWKWRESMPWEEGHCGTQERGLCASRPLTPSCLVLPPCACARAVCQRREHSGGAPHHPLGRAAHAPHAPPDAQRRTPGAVHPPAGAGPVGWSGSAALVNPWTREERADVSWRSTRSTDKDFAASLASYLEHKTVADRVLSSTTSTRRAPTLSASRAATLSRSCALPRVPDIVYMSLDRKQEPAAAAATTAAEAAAASPAAGAAAGTADAAPPHAGAASTGPPPAPPATTTTAAAAAEATSPGQPPHPAPRPPARRRPTSAPGPWGRPSIFRTTPS